MDLIEETPETGDESSIFRALSSSGGFSAVRLLLSLCPSVSFISRSASRFFFFAGHAGYGSLIRAYFNGCGSVCWLSLQIRSVPGLHNKKNMTQVFVYTFHFPLCFSRMTSLRGKKHLTPSPVDVVP